MNQEHIGKFIAKLRHEKNLTQEELAVSLGVNNRTISRWENGYCMPDLSMLIPLSEQFDVTVYELLKGERDNFEKKETEKQKDIIKWSLLFFKRMIKKFVKIIIIILLIVVIAFIVVTLILEYNQKEFKMNLDDVDISICKSSDDKLYLTIYGNDDLPVLYNIKENDDSLNFYAYRMRYQIRNEELLQEYGKVSSLDRKSTRLNSSH